MTVEEAISSILARCPTLTRQDVEREIQERIKASGKLLTEASAARLVAAGYGVAFNSEKSSPKLFIEQLVSGLNDVTITGRVVVLGSTRSFSGRKRRGKVAHLTIADKTGRIRVVVWNEKADLLNEIRLDQLIVVEHGYVRKSKYGQNELHVGHRGNFHTVQEPSTEIALLPIEKLDRNCCTIGLLREGVNIEMIQGTVKTSPNLREVTTRKGDRVLLASFELEDQTGKIRVTAWEEQARRVAELTVGSKVTLENVHVRKGFADQLEIAIQSSTRIVT